MKKAYTSVFHFLLAVIILVSGMSFTVKKMVCLSSGNVQVGLYSLDGCCGDEEEGSCEDPKLDSKCCDYSSEVFDLDKEIVFKSSSFKQADLTLLQFAPVPYPGLRSQVQQAPHFTYADLPPPLSGRKLLSFIGILTI